MKNFIAFALLLMATPVIAQKTPVGVTYDAKIIRAIDGDTIVIAAPYLPAPLKPELGVRIFGVDTPEKSFRAKCESEKVRGEQASVFVKDVIAGTKKHQVVLYDWDKFGGRVLGDILLDGMSLRDLLIKNSFARAYFGDAKQSWCN
jgi:endonuclease YncB( thermonuclease family)